ncbi:MAG: CoA-binding protein [Spirochaetes bacterium]|nr:CoA-binding protein [Spirochaetota bacterium]
MKDLSKLFYPGSVAVIGASENVLKWGSIIISNVLDGGFKGEVHPVSTSNETVYGRRASKSLRDIGAPADLLIITTPAATVMGILRDCVATGIRNVVIVSSGFSEAGEEGRRHEREVREFALANGLNVVGPNTMGIANFKEGLHGMFSHVRLKKGGISLMAQSGNVGNQIMYWAEQQSIGMSKFVGSGNEAALMCEDYLDYFHGDADTSVIIMYLEGVDNGRSFMEAARRTTRDKPVVLLKGGRTRVGTKAAMSHTGALAGRIQIFSAAMEQAGVSMVDSQSEMLTLAAAFDSMPLPKGNRIGVVTLGGGWGVITADECEERGLTLPPLPEDVKARLDKMLPSFWSKGNPVDLVGQPDPNLFRESVEAMISSDAYDAVILLGIINSFKTAMRLYEATMRLGKPVEMNLEDMERTLDDLQNVFLDNIADLMEKYEKPIYPVALVAQADQPVVHAPKSPKKYNAIIFRTPEEAVSCLAKQYRYSRYLRKQGRKP